MSGTHGVPRRCARQPRRIRRVGWHDGQERRALLRRRPTVTSWRRLLETARTEYERGAGLLPLDEEEVYERYAAVG